jgi:hypothetical protein
LQDHDFSVIELYRRYPSGLAYTLLSSRGSTFRQILHPSPNKILFQSLFNISMPFLGKEIFMYSYPPKMASRPLLESGEWVGYHSYSMNLGNARIDPPITRIYFTADPAFDHCGVQALGIDIVGNFTLSGSVRENGVVLMAKTYSQGFSWNGTASMMPFGIVGTWGQAHTPHGQLWLWKKEWS